MYFNIYIYANSWIYNTSVLVHYLLAYLKSIQIMHNNKDENNISI